MRIRRQPQQQQAQGFDAQAGNGYAKAAEAVDHVAEQQARTDKTGAKQAQAQRGVFPVVGGVIQGDKGGDGAKTNRTQRQTCTVGQHPAQHVQKRQAHAADNGRGHFWPGQQQAQRGQGNDAHAQAPHAQMPDHHHAQRCANGNGAVAGDAVPGNHLGGVGSAYPANAPADRPRTHQAFSAAQHQPA